MPPVAQEPTTAVTSVTTAQDHAHRRINGPVTRAAVDAVVPGATTSGLPSPVPGDRGPPTDL